MMRLLSFLLIILLTGCGKESSPEGRMQIKIETLEKKIDDLNSRNNALADSVMVIHEEVRALKTRR
jgi:outer membrane murein-binding lipoprotein Lpp